MHLRHADTDVANVFDAAHDPFAKPDSTFDRRMGGAACRIGFQAKAELGQYLERITPGFELFPIDSVMVIEHFGEPIWVFEDLRIGCDTLPRH